MPFYIQANGHPVKVRVLERYEYHGRRRVLVEALPVNGRVIRPFSSWTHGGWTTSATTKIPEEFLKTKP